MTLPVNILQAVATYSDPSLMYLENLNCFISTLNHEYKNFQDRPANLGDTINVKLPTRSTASAGLVANFFGAQERLIPLICDQSANSSMAFDTQDFIFNAEKYMKEFGMSRIEELSAQIEANVAKNADSSVPVYTVNDQGQSVPTGALHTESGPYRFYDATQSGLTSFQQLADINYRFRNYGSAAGELKVYLDDESPIQITGSGLNQFVQDRNEEIANSWDLGTYKGARAQYYKSNLLTTHISGSLGQAGTTLTLVTVDDTTGNNVTTLTFSGAGTGTVNSGDVGEFIPTSGFNDMRFLTFIGHVPCKQPVQVRVLSDATAAGGNITVSVIGNGTGAGLNWAGGVNKNLNQPLEPGMQFKFVGNHRAAIVVAGDAFYMAMPRLPDEDPYPTSVVVSKDTGASLRLYYGSRFAQNFRGMVNDCLWASLAGPEYTMRICLPA